MSATNQQMDIYHIDTLIHSIYDKVYGSGKYVIKLIDITHLSLDRFKLSDYDLDTIFEKKQIILEGDYSTYVRTDAKKLDTEISQIYFKRKASYPSEINIRIVPYISKDGINNMSDPMNVNQIMRTLLSELVVTGKTTNLLLPIINIDVTGDDLVKYNFVDGLIDQKKYYSIELTEKFFKMSTLEEFIKEEKITEVTLLSIIYQIVDVLLHITMTYPGFKHFKVLPDTIDCYYKAHNGITYPEIKIGNFFLATITDLIPNNYLEKLNLPHLSNPYSEIYQFTNHLWNHHRLDIEKYSILLHVFDYILPKKIRSGENEYLTNELWNSLSGEEKEKLNIRGIKNFMLNIINVPRIPFVTLSKTVETNKLSRVEAKESAKESAKEDADNATLTDKELEELNDESIPIIEKINQTKIDGETDENNNLREESVRTDTSENTNTSEKKRTGKKDRTDSSDMEEVDESDDVDVDDDFDLDTALLDSENGKINQDYLNDKKSLDNDIESMRKKSNKSTNFNEFSDIEVTETREPTKPARVVNMTEHESLSTGNKGNKNNGRKYKGKRYVRPQMNDIDTEVSRLFSNQYDPNTQLNSYNMDTSQTHNPVNMPSNSQPSRINSIGQLLGTNPNDLAKSANVDYSKIAQQFYQTGMPQGLVPSTSQGQNQMLPNNSLTGQLPTSQASQMPIYGQDEALQRYLSASSQGMQNMDPNMMALMQQQFLNQSNGNPSMALPQMGIPQMAQMQQMPQQFSQMPMSSAPQMMQGGGRNNQQPFFFRQ